MRENTDQKNLEHSNDVMHYTSKERKGKTSKPENEVRSVLNQSLPLSRKKKTEKKSKKKELVYVFTNEKNRLSEKQIFPSVLRKPGKYLQHTYLCDTESRPKKPSSLN